MARSTLVTFLRRCGWRRSGDLPHWGRPATHIIRFADILANSLSALDDCRIDRHFGVRSRMSAPDPVRGPGDSSWTDWSDPVPPGGRILVALIQRLGCQRSSRGRSRPMAFRATKRSPKVARRRSVAKPRWLSSGCLLRAVSGQSIQRWRADFEPPIGRLNSAKSAINPSFSAIYQSSELSATARTALTGSPRPRTALPA